MYNIGIPFLGFFRGKCLEYHHRHLFDDTIMTTKLRRLGKTVLVQVFQTALIELPKNFLVKNRNPPGPNDNAIREMWTRSSKRIMFDSQN